MSSPIPFEYDDYTIDCTTDDAPAYQQFRSYYYTGATDPASGQQLRPNAIIPSSPNFPKPPDIPSRYYIYFPYYIDITNDTPGGREIIIYDVTDGVVLTRTTGSVIQNREFKVSFSPDSKQRNAIEFHPNQQGHEIAYDFWGEGGVLTADGINAFKFSADLVNTNVDSEHVTTRTTVNNYTLSAQTVSMGDYAEGTNTDFTQLSPPTELINISGQGKGTLFWEVTESNSGNPTTYQEELSLSVDGGATIDLFELSSGLSINDGLYLEFNSSIIVTGRAGNYALNARYVTAKIVYGTY